jgi:hypothetical protein
MKRVHALLIVILGLSTLRALPAQRPTAPDGGTDRIVAAARSFLASLDDGQRAKASLELNAKTRTVWSNLPSGATMQTGATERNGLKLALMTPAQEKAALALVATTLSRDGYQKVMAIVDADQVLEERSAATRATGSRTRFGRGEYYVAILGAPSTTTPWMVQFGGHHLAINVTVAGRDNVLTPTHTGTQPASYTVEGRTVRPLGDENDKAFTLMGALSPEQQKQAVLGYEVRNLVLPPGADGKVIQPEGVRASSFNPAQRAMLVDLVREWVGIVGDEAAAVKMKEVEGAIADTYFAWAGPTTAGKGAYFRIQGPSLFVEYAPQGRGDTNVDHIHTMYRDPTNDYAAKAMRR